MALAESEMVKVDTAAMIANRYFLVIKTPYKKQSSSGIAVAEIDALKTVTPTAIGNRYFLTFESPVIIVLTSHSSKNAVEVAIKLHLAR
jgi:hypothetical protein